MLEYTEYAKKFLSLSFSEQIQVLNFIDFLLTKALPHKKIDIAPKKELLDFVVETPRGNACDEYIRQLRDNDRI